MYYVSSLLERNRLMSFRFSGRRHETDRQQGSAKIHGFRQTAGRNLRVQSCQRCRGTGESSNRIEHNLWDFPSFFELIIEKLSKKSNICLVLIIGKLDFKYNGFFYNEREAGHTLFDHYYCIIHFCHCFVNLCFEILNLKVFINQFEYLFEFIENFNCLELTI